MHRRGHRSRAAAHPIDVAAYEVLFRRVWASVVTVLGVTSTRSLFEHARAEAAVRYQALTEVRIVDDGVSLRSLARLTAEHGEDPAHLREALGAYLEVFTQILEKLSGELLRKRVLGILAKDHHGAELGAMLYRTGLNF